MPSKEQAAINEHQSTEESFDKQSPVLKTSSNLIQRLYVSLLQNSSVQSGLRLAKEKYEVALAESCHQLKIFRQVSEGTLKNLCYTNTIYNALTGLWLVKNLPFDANGPISYEDFNGSVKILITDQGDQLQKVVKAFYSFVNDAWSKLKSPTLEEVKKTCLFAAAQTIAADYQITIPTYPTLLCELFLALEARSNSLLSNEAFYLCIRKRMNLELENEVLFQRATKVFYTFAKRFALLEFPVTYGNQHHLSVFIKCLIGKFDVAGELVLTQIDCIANLIAGALGIQFEEKDGPISNSDRLYQIIQKLIAISSQSFERSRNAIQETRVYKFSDQYIHFDDRYKEIEGVALFLYTHSLNLLSTVSDKIHYVYDTHARKVVVSLYQISEATFKRNYAYLCEKYSILKDATINLKDKVLEIELNQAAFERLGASAKQYFSELYQEIRHLDVQRLQLRVSKAYQEALGLFKSKPKAQLTNESKDSRSSKTF